MKLNYNCLRDVLLAVEAHEYIDNDLKLSELWHSDLMDLPELGFYDKKDVTYAAMIAIESGLMLGKFQAANEEIDFLYIMRLTAEGHDFIENIRSDLLWEQICELGESTGIMSISMIKSTAPQIIMRYLREMQDR